MAKSSLYSAHRAAGASSGRYKASLYDIANVGYAMEADVGIESQKEQQRQAGWATLEAALSLADTAYGAHQSKQRQEKLESQYPWMKPSGDEKGTGESKKPTVESKKQTVDVMMGTKENPFELSGTGTKAVGDLFRQAKEAGIEEGSKIWGKIGEEVKQWEYIYK